MSCSQSDITHIKANVRVRVPTIPGSTNCSPTGGSADMLFTFPSPLPPIVSWTFPLHLRSDSPSDSPCRCQQSFAWGPFFRKRNRFSRPPASAASSPSPSSTSLCHLRTCKVVVVSVRPPQSVNRTLIPLGATSGKIRRLTASFRRSLNENPSVARSVPTRSEPLQSLQRLVRTPLVA